VITVLRALVPLTKIHTWLGDSWQTEDYQRARRFRHTERPCEDLNDLYEILRDIQHDHQSAIVRGRPISDGLIRRRIHKCAETGALPDLVEVDRQWICIDVDGIDWSGELDDAAAEAARARLPAWLSRAGCVYQWSASAGIKPGLRVHLWIWLDRAVYGRSLRKHLRSTGVADGVDLSTLSDAQIHYTARPIVIGADDPIQTRLGRLPGLPAVVPPPVTTIAEWERQERLARFNREMAAKSVRYDSAKKQKRAKKRYAEATVRGVIEDIASAPEGDRHATIYRGAARVAGLAKSGLVDHDALSAVEATAAAILPPARAADVPRIVEDAARLAEPVTLDHLGATAAPTPRRQVRGQWQPQATVPTVARPRRQYRGVVITRCAGCLFEFSQWVETRNGWRPRGEQTEDVTQCPQCRGNEAETWAGWEAAGG
jgi:hypothetical protein